MKKYIAEMLGTMVLVLMGCGTAVSLSCTSADPNLAATVIGTALAFGLQLEQRYQRNDISIVPKA